MLTEFCKLNTNLEDSQIKLLARICKYIEFAATASSQEVVFFTKGKTEGTLVILDSVVNRNNTIEFFKPQTLVSTIEVPLWDKVFYEHKTVQGKQELKLGKFVDLAVFPIIDNGGKVIGGIAFIDSFFTKDAYLLAETAFMAIMVPDVNNKALYREVSYQAGVIIFDESGSILFASQTAEQMINLLGFDRRIIGSSIYGGRLKLSFVKQSLAKHKGDEMEEIYDNIVLHQRIIPIISGGKVCRSYLILEDKTEKRKAEQRLLVKNSMIKEIHHRVKNNLQAISGLLRMQARRTKSEEVRDELVESISRIESISLVHNMLCNYSEDLLGLHQICHELLRLLSMSMLNYDQDIDAYYEGEDIKLSSDQASYVALVINEIISNAFKHAFKGRKKGKLVIKGQEFDDGVIEISSVDDGVGIEDDFDLYSKKSLGMQILKNIVEGQLNGQISFGSNEYGGCSVKIKFKREE